MTATRPLTCRNPRLTGWAAILCAMTLLIGQPSAQADETEQDLQGILPDYIPDGLSEGDFDELADNWTEWARETGGLVSDFYASDDDLVRARRATLEQIRVKLDTMNAALSDPQYLAIYGPLADLYGRLSRRIGVAEALLETVEQDVAAPAEARLDSRRGDLAGEARALRSHFRGIEGGDKWVAYFRLDQIAAAAEQRETSDEALFLIDAVRQKLDSRGRLDDEQRAFLSREPVFQFEDALNNYVSLFSVSLDDPDGRRQLLRDLAATLLEAIEVYEGEPTSENMGAVRHAFDDLRRTAPDGAMALTRAMRKHYLNYNLRVVLDETLAQDLIRDTRMESGFINEMVSKAHITGCQWTNTTVNLDLKPCDNGVRFDLVLDGTVRSRAQGETHVATVYTSGRHCFQGRKKVQFDGDHFCTWPARVGVGGSNNPYAAKTCISWVPLLGGLMENVAINIADSPENNQFARNKIYQEARSQFDRETANMLNEAELTIESDVAGPLREGGYYPDVKHFSSTETDLLMRTRLMESGELGGGDTLPLPIYPTHGVLVQAHESLLNQVGNRLNLDGKRFTPDEFEQYVQDELERIVGQPVDLGSLTGAQEDPQSDSPKIEEIVFHEIDALRFQVRDGEVVLILSMGLKLEGREEIEPQRISVPLKVSLVGDKVLVQRGTVGVSPIGRVDPRNRAQQIARAGVMRTKIQEVIETQEIDATLEATIQDKTITLRVTDLRARGGWLSIIATDGITEVPGEETDGAMLSSPLKYVRGTTTTRR